MRLFARGEHTVSERGLPACTGPATIIVAQQIPQIFGVKTLYEAVEGPQRAEELIFADDVRLKQKKKRSSLQSCHSVPLQVVPVLCRCACRRYLDVKMVGLLLLLDHRVPQISRVHAVRLAVALTPITELLRHPVQV